MDGRPRSVGGVSVMVLSLERFLEANEIITTRPDVDSFGFVVVDSYKYFYEYLLAYTGKAKSLENQQFDPVGRADRI